jgi:hypothetical protein
MLSKHAEDYLMSQLQKRLYKIAADEIIEANEDDEEKRARKRKLVYGLISAGLIGAGGLGAYYAMKKDETTGETPLDRAGKWLSGQAEKAGLINPKQSIGDILSGLAPGTTGTGIVAGLKAADLAKARSSVGDRARAVSTALNENDGDSTKAKDALIDKSLPAKIKNFIGWSGDNEAYRKMVESLSGFDKDTRKALAERLSSELSSDSSAYNSLRPKNQKSLTDVNTRARTLPNLYNPKDKGSVENNLGNAIAQTNAEVRAPGRVARFLRDKLNIDFRPSVRANDFIKTVNTTERPAGIDLDKALPLQPNLGSKALNQDTNKKVTVTPQVNTETRNQQMAALKEKLNAGGLKKNDLTQALSKEVADKGVATLGKQLGQPNLTPEHIAALKRYHTASRQGGLGYGRMAAYGLLAEPTARVTGSVLRSLLSSE